LWDLTNGKELRRFEGPAGEVWAVAFADEGRLALSGGRDGCVRVWDLSSGREAGCVQAHDSLVTAVVWVPEGRRVLSAGYDRTARLWALPQVP
jgi:WD40 repeat protein